MPSRVHLHESVLVTVYCYITKDLVASAKNVTALVVNPLCSHAVQIVDIKTVSAHTLELMTKYLYRAVISPLRLENAVAFFEA